METIYMRVIITYIATFTAILFITLSYLFQNYSVLILTIEVILLPSIYIIGNYYIESLLERKYRQELDFISKKADELNEKYNKQRFLNLELRLSKKNGKKTI